MNNYKARLVGDVALLLHSCAGLDKFHPIKRELDKLTSKKKKTDDDLLEIKRIEWHMSLYIDESYEVAIPADNIMAAIIEGARKSKLGKQAQAAVFEDQPSYKLIYDGPKDPKALYDTGSFCDYRPVRNQQNRVMRSRPIFRKWSVDISLHFDETLLDPQALHQAIVTAGAQIGLGDYRPRYGRFHVER